MWGGVVALLVLELLALLLRKLLPLLPLMMLLLGRRGWGLLPLWLLVLLLESKLLLLVFIQLTLLPGLLVMRLLGWLSLPTRMAALTDRSWTHLALGVVRDRLSLRVVRVAKLLLLKLRLLLVGSHGCFRFTNNRHRLFVFSSFLSPCSLTTSN